MIHSRILRERFYGREIYISRNKNDKNVISRINCVTGSVGTLSRSRLDYTLAVDERFTLDTRCWSGIEYLCWTRKSPVPKTWSLLCICLILNRLQSLNLHFLIKKWELYYFSHKMVKRITCVMKRKVFGTGLLLLLLSLFFFFNAPDKASGHRTYSFYPHFFPDMDSSISPFVVKLKCIQVFVGMGGQIKSGWGSTTLYLLVVTWK